MPTLKRITVTFEADTHMTDDVLRETIRQAIEDEGEVCDDALYTLMDSKVKLVPDTPFVYEWGPLTERIRKVVRTVDTAPSEQTEEYIDGIETMCDPETYIKMTDTEIITDFQGYLKSISEIQDAYNREDERQDRGGFEVGPECPEAMTSNPPTE